MVSQARTVRSFVQALRHEWGVAVSYIADRYNPEGVVPDALASDYAGRVASYGWAVECNRLVLRSVAPEWETRVSGISIRDEPRLEAARKYATLVRERVPALEDFQEPAMKGNPGSPVYSELVSLSPEATVLRHLVELCGSDALLVFTVERAPSGVRALYFERLTFGELIH